MSSGLNKCCFCIELRTGSLIVGYLSLVLTIVLTLWSILLTFGATTISKDKQAEAVNVAMILSVILLIFIIINLIFVIVLLVGLHQEKRGHVKAYLIYSTIFLVIIVVFFIVDILIGNGNGNNKGNIIGNIIRNIIILALGIYFLMVIRSHYLKMDDSSKRPAVYNTA